MRGAVPLLLVLATAFGCQSNKSDAIVAAPTTGAQPTPAAPAAAQGISGKVLERLDAAPYCYLRIQTAKGEVWAAVPEAKVEKGAEVTVANPMLMNNFESKTLNRTFPEVFFGTLGGAPGSASAGSAPATAAPAGAPVPDPVLIAKVDKATGADARTVAELWTQKGSLKDKPITVRGKVVKYNPGVMGKNWIHLQDGTGAAGSNDLLVTSDTQVKAGDTVLVTGKVAADKDFGAGYKFSILIEDAKIVVE